MTAMGLHNLTAPTHRRRDRVGRGISAGRGKTAGRGTKGQKARSGYKLPRRFEGGQVPLISRLPKKKGQRRRSPKPITVRIDRVLARVKDDQLTPKILLKSGLISAAEARQPIKIVGSVKDLRPIKWTGPIKLTKALVEQLGQRKK